MNITADKKNDKLLKTNGLLKHYLFDVPFKKRTLLTKSWYCGGGKSVLVIFYEKYLLAQFGLSQEIPTQRT